MTATPSKSKAQRVRERRQAGARRGRSSRVVAAASVVVAGLAVAGLVWWTADGEPDTGQPGQVVEEFTHIHGLEITSVGAR